MYEAGVYLILAAIVLQIIRNFKEAKAFGKKGGFGLGLSIGPICTVISNVTGVNLSWLFWYLTPIFNMHWAFHLTAVAVINAGKRVHNERYWRFRDVVDAVRAEGRTRPALDA